MSKIVINGVDGNFGSLVAKYALELMNKEDLVFTAPKEESLKEYKDQGIKTAIAIFNDPEGLVKVFENDEFGQLSVIVKNNKEYIEAIEVATILGYSNPRDAINRHCDKDGVVFSDVRVVTGIKKDNSKAFKVVTKKFIDEGNIILTSF